MQVGTFFSTAEVFVIRGRFMCDDLYEFYSKLLKIVIDLSICCRLAVLGKVT